MQIKPAYRLFWTLLVIQLLNISVLCTPHYLGNQEDAESYYKIGTQLYKQGNYKEAVDNFKKAIKLKPDYPEASRDLSNAYFSLGQYKEAEAEFKPVMSYARKLSGDTYDEEWMDAYINYSTALSLLGKIQDSGLFFGVVVGRRLFLNIFEPIHLKVDNAEAYYALGIAYYIGQYGEEAKNEAKRKAAIESFQQAVRLKPDFAETYCYLGHAYSRLQPEEAIADYKKAIELKPDFYESPLGLGGIYQDTHRYTEAVEYFHKALELNPRAYGIYFHLVRTYLDMGDRDSAIKEYNKLKSLLPKASITKEVYGLIEDFSKNKK